MPVPLAAAMGLQLGGQAASGAIDQGLGLLFAGPNRKAQLKTATGLQNLQIAGQKELTDYNAAKQLQMWKDTSYPAQLELMNKAGINPALMYGMGGGGGQTSNVATGSVTGQSAKEPQAKGDTGMGIQAALLTAQIENIKADTEQKKAEAAKTSGVDTENIKAQTDLTRVNGEIAKVQASVSRQTINEQMKSWENLISKQTEEIKQLKLTQAETQERTKLYTAQIAAQAITNGLTQALKEKTETERGQIIRMNDAQIKYWADQIAVQWTNAESERINARANEEKAGADDTEGLEKLVMLAIGTILGKNNPVSPAPIKGFHNR